MDTSGINKKISRFSNQMLVELRNNDAKGSITKWKGIRDKLIDLEYHKAKLLVAIKTKNEFAIREYIADCANILFSIGDEFSIYDNDCEKVNKEAIFIDNPIEIRELGSSKRTNLTP